MTPRIQGDGGLGELKAAAERVLYDVNHNVRVQDSITLATFVRDLLGRDRSTWSPRFALNYNSEPRVWMHGHSLTIDDARRLAADLLRAAEQAEASASQAVHPGRPAGEEGR